MRQRIHRGSLSVVLTVLGLIVPVALTTSEAHATFPGRNGLIAVQFDVACADQIRVMQVTGRGEQRVTIDCDEGDPPLLREWTPDGHHLLLARWGSDRLWFKAPAFSAREVPLSGRYKQPSISPGGTRLAFVRYPPQSETPAGVTPMAEIWSARLDGSNLRRLGEGEFPRWSPDGRRIAYIEPVRRLPDGSYSRAHLSLMDARTGRPIRRLVEFDPLYPGASGDIDWAPHGRSLVFSFDDRPDVRIVSTSGLGIRHLVGHGGAPAHSAVYSPDGRRVLFAQDAEIGDAEFGTVTRHDIRVISARGGRTKRVRLGPRQEDIESGSQAPRLSWQPLR